MFFFRTLFSLVLSQRNKTTVVKARATISFIRGPTTSGDLMASRFVTDIFKLFGTATFRTDAPRITGPLGIGEIYYLGILTKPSALGTAEH
jgi:hypothetical protein